MGAKLNAFSDWCSRTFRSRYVQSLEQTVAKQEERITELTNTILAHASMPQIGPQRVPRKMAANIQGKRMPSQYRAEFETYDSRKINEKELEQ